MESPHGQGARVPLRLARRGIRRFTREMSDSDMERTNDAGRCGDDRRRMNRRGFLGSAAATASAAALTTLAPASALGANERVVVAVMGTNGRGRTLARGFAGLAGATVAFVCDVDERAIVKGKKAVTDAGGAAPTGVKDVRRVLDEKSVDALIVAAPNHWHAPASILACTAGKHV